MIRLNHVSKIYGDGSKKAVDDLSWDIEDGKITGFIGPNGAGKTTTLKMITGILAPSEGTIEINGKDIQKDPLEAKRQFGFVPDDPDAFLRVRGIEYLILWQISTVSERKNVSVLSKKPQNALRWKRTFRAVS